MSEETEKIAGGSDKLDELVSSPVKKVNHGKAFGREDWFTFYCGECGSQLEGRQERCRCGVVAEWNDND